ncbi:cadherin-related family member 2-like [Arapaima gigas]
MHLYYTVFQASETKPNVHGELASTSTDMNITIGDVNDNKPEFFDCMAGSCVLATSFSGNINENAPSGEFVKGMDIKVEDVDAVVAIDKGNENLRSTATVTIQINDINDNYPTFKKETYNLKDINDNKPVFRSAFYAFYVKESIMGE